MEVPGYPPAVQRFFWIRLCYDATLVWGRDITEGRDIPPAERRAWARGYFQALSDSTRQAAGLSTENGTDCDLPEEPAHV